MTIKKYLKFEITLDMVHHTHLIKNGSQMRLFYFQNIFEMQQFVLSFLRDREVTPSQPHTKLDPSKRKFSA